MGEIIARKGALAEIVDAIETTLIRGRTKDGIIRVRVEERLGRYEQLLAGAADAKAEAAREKEEAKASVLTLVEKVRGTYGEVKDEVYNFLGRPQNDPTMAMLFSVGMVEMGAATPGRAAHLALVVAETMRKLEFRTLDAARVQGWAGRLESAASAVVEGVGVLERAGAKATQASASYTGLVRAAWWELPALKRVLKADGLTEAQIHAVIPESPKPRRRPAENGHDRDAVVTGTSSGDGNAPPTPTGG